MSPARFECDSSDDAWWCEACTLRWLSCQAVCGFLERDLHYLSRQCASRDVESFSQLEQFWHEIRSRTAHWQTQLYRLSSTGTRWRGDVGSDWICSPCGLLSMSWSTGKVGRPRHFFMWGVSCAW